MSYGNPPEQRNWLTIGCLVFVTVAIPIVGHIILTFMIVQDDLSTLEKVLWLIAVWAIPFLGPLLYLALGQKRNRLLAL